MKKRILLFTAITGMAAAMLISGKNGAGAEKGYDCTGSETALGDGAGCARATGCHGTGATTGINVVLELDSAGVSTVHYKGGMTYTVKITGTNNTTNSLPQFGFQVSCIKGSTSLATPVNAGTFATTGLPTNVRYTPATAHDFVCNMIEQSDPIIATTGFGAMGSTYVESFEWTAPTAGTGTVSFWGALNAVVADTPAPPSALDSWNTTNLTVNEWTSSTSIAAVTNNISLTAYPNPAIDYFTLQMTNAEAGTYSVQVYDMNGRTVTAQNMAVNNSSQTSNINTSNWQPGTYSVVIEKDGYRKVINVVKL